MSPARTTMSPTHTTGHFVDVADGWNERYRERPSFRARLQIVGATILEELSRRPPRTVIDVGAGTCVFSAIASHCAENVIALDTSREMLTAGLRHLDALSALVAPMGVVPNFSAIHRVLGTLDSIAAGAVHRVDLILAIAVLEYLTDVEDAMLHIAAILAPGGAVIVTVPDPGSMFRRSEGVLNAMAVSLAKVYPSERLSSRAYGRVRPSGNTVPWQSATARAGLSVTLDRPVPLGLTGLRSHLVPSRLLVLRRVP